MSDRIEVGKIPERETVFSYLDKLTDCVAIYSSMTPKVKAKDVLELNLSDVDIGLLLDDVLSIIATHGVSGWRQRGGESTVYGGFSINYNPDHLDGLPAHVSSIGAPRNARNESAWSETLKDAYPKNSYFDTYGFRYRTEVSRQGDLGKFLDSCQRSLIRSRVGVIDGSKVDVDDPEYRRERGWHRDELLVENVRINIPLQSDESFVLELEGRAPSHLAVGHAYTWDTNQTHRVYCAHRTDNTRIHLVLGFSPWFDYDQGSDSWAANEFFGKLHPLDMIAEGVMIPKISYPNPH